jgi:hypothetical protein
MLKTLEGMMQEAEQFTEMVPKLKNKIADVEKMMHSILKDISEYGVPGRENQTDDLTLTIELPK